MQDGLWTTSEMKKSAISKNKAAFKIYVESFDEGHEVVAMKRRRRENKEAKIKEASLNSSPRKAASPLATAVLSGHLSTEKYVSRVISSGSAEKFKPTIPTRKRVRKSASSVTELPVASTSTENNTVTADDEELLAITVEFEKSLESTVHVHQPTATQQSATTEHVENGLQQGTTTSLALSFNNMDPENPPLPQGGKKTLPKSDQLWISQALFTTGTNGKAKLDWHRYVCLLLCNEDIFEKILLKRKKHFQVLGGGLPNLAPSISSELLRTGFSFP